MPSGGVMTRAHPQNVLSNIGDGTLGPRGANLVEEKPRHLVRVDGSYLPY
jgi:hypothetical protein